jgi:class 3 adenylate cyclase
MDVPETRYAWNGDVALAYQVLGEGSSDLVYLQGLASNVMLNWEHPSMARFLRALARERRLIVTDRRGTGCSERFTPSDVIPLEEMVDDLATVLDAVGSDRTTFFASHECTMPALLFAATFPERTAGLVLFEIDSVGPWSEETPWEWTPEQWEASLELWRDWGTRGCAERLLRQLMPSLADDPAEIDRWTRYMALSSAPGAGVSEVRRWASTDVRHVLPSIQVPTMVLHRPDASLEIDAARYAAQRIPGAILEELPGPDVVPWVGDQGAVLHAVDRFLGQVRQEQESFDRFLATVLFTDIVGSTEKLAELGDRAWRDLVERHHQSVRALLGRFRGVEMDTAGDGFFATFDGPARAVRCAQAIVGTVGRLGIEVRAGVHTGEVETIDGKAGGLAVVIGTRVGAAAKASEILATSTVKELVAGSGLVFEDAGEHELKGVPDRWRLYRVVA